MGADDCGVHTSSARHGEGRFDGTCHTARCIAEQSWFGFTHIGHLCACEQTRIQADDLRELSHYDAGADHNNKPGDRDLNDICTKVDLWHHHINDSIAKQWQHDTCDCRQYNSDDGCSNDRSPDDCCSTNHTDVYCNFQSSHFKWVKLRIAY